MMDPEAAHIVFESVKEEHTITLLPWETCIDGDMNLSMVTILLQRLLKKHTQFPFPIGLAH